MCPRWILELYLSPSPITPWVFLTLFLTAFVLLLTIAWLHWIEKVHDKHDNGSSILYSSNGPRCVISRLRHYPSASTEDGGCNIGPCGCQALRTIEA